MTSIQSLLPEATTAVGNATNATRWKELYSRATAALQNQPNFRQELAKILNTSPVTDSLAVANSGTATATQSATLQAAATSYDTPAVVTPANFGAAVDAYVKNGVIAGAQALAASRHASVGKGSDGSDQSDGERKDIAA